MLDQLFATEVQTQHAGVGVGIAALVAVFAYLGRVVYSFFRNEDGTFDKPDED